MDDEPQRSEAFQLLRDLLQGRASLRSARRFYEAAANAHNPDLAARLEETADRAVRGT